MNPYSQSSLACIIRSWIDFDAFTYIYIIIVAILLYTQPFKWALVYIILAIIIITYANRCSHSPSVFIRAAIGYGLVSIIIIVAYALFYAISQCSIRS